MTLHMLNHVEVFVDSAHLLVIVKAIVVFPAGSGKKLTREHNLILFFTVNSCVISA